MPLPLYIYIDICICIYIYGPYIVHIYLYTRIYMIGPCQAATNQQGHLLRVPPGALSHLGGLLDEEWLPSCLVWARPCHSLDMAVFLNRGSFKAGSLTPGGGGRLDEKQLSIL